ncbi:MAG TPA: DUF4169 family protein [Henriciella marina]|uniref:DUF4169 family protein n=1 Tax=Henriciella sp. TaxID=1968823 RepID=UPI0018029860|nr:DUF4169 family protein [Henriciella sp.]HIG23831.1 DUF4169 family protein [Henriciella sp.]HIK64896.1 DUF4169 family protein [Henriciella marina]
MTTPINLNKARKQKQRVEAEKKAAENRVKFGRTKAEKAAQKSEADRLCKGLDGAEREQ